MLEIFVPSSEAYDEEKNEFISLSDGGKIVIEHSLVSISKWESIYHKPFLSKEEKTNSETIEYIKCMTITQNVPKELYATVAGNPMLMKKIENYISNPMTATTFSNRSRRARSNTIITSEVIYYWMFSYGIPIDCQKWHLNRLLTLINVFSSKNEPQKPMSKKDTAMHYAKLNAQRRKMLNSKG